MNQEDLEKAKSLFYAIMIPLTLLGQDAWNLGNPKDKKEKDIILVELHLPKGTQKIFNSMKSILNCPQSEYESAFFSYLVGKGVTYFVNKNGEEMVKTVKSILSEGDQS